MVNPIPEAYGSITPYIIVHDAEAAIAFYTKAFGASETMRLSTPDGKKIMHAEMKIGDSLIMFADEFPEMGFTSPKTVGGTATSIMIYTENADAMYEAAVAAGATAGRPVADQFYGDRMGWLTDPFGHKWSIATHTEDLSEEEIYKRFNEMMASGEGKGC